MEQDIGFEPMTFSLATRHSTTELILLISIYLMANDFCRFLSNGYRFKSEGTKLVYQPCCWYSKEIPVLNNPDFHRQKNELSQVNDWIPECESCRKIEATGAYGNRSPRLRSFEEITDSSVPDDVPVWIELSIDTTCNAACIMCGPWHSTTWRRQEIKFGIRTAEQMPDLVPAEYWWTELALPTLCRQPTLIPNKYFVTSQN